MSNTSKTVLVVDQHPLVRHALAKLVSSETHLDCIGEAADAATALEFVSQHRPDLAIVDLRLGSGCGLQLVKDIRKLGDFTKILIYTSFDPSVYAERALRSGAQGYITKRDEISDCLEAIQQVLRGDVVLSKCVNQQLLAGMSAEGQSSAPARLTDREIRVLELMGSGFSTREIAAQLALSTKTIESHRERIKAKLDIRCAARLNRHAVEWVLSRN